MYSGKTRSPFPLLSHIHIIEDLPQAVWFAFGMSNIPLHARSASQFAAFHAVVLIVSPVHIKQSDPKKVIASTTDFKIKLRQYKKWYTISLKCLTQSLLDISYQKSWKWLPWFCWMLNTFKNVWAYSRWSSLLTLERNILFSIASFPPSISVGINTSVKIQTVSAPTQQLSVNTAWLRKRIRGDKRIMIPWPIAIDYNVNE